MSEQDVGERLNESVICNSAQLQHSAIVHLLTPWSESSLKSENWEDIYDWAA